MDAADVIKSGEYKESISEELIDPIKTIKKGKVLVKMIGESGSWLTPSGVKFTTESPFQLLSFHEADSLIRNQPYRFAEGKAEEVKAFYGLEKKEG